MHPRRRTKLPLGKDDPQYAQLWKIVDGAVADAFNNHPRYLAHTVSRKVVRTSINKRVVGALLSYVTDLRGGAVGPDGDNAG